MMSQFIHYRMRTNSKQLCHTNARYGGASQRSAASLSWEAARPDSGPNSRPRTYQLTSNI
eukprot:3473174-Pleurochrysis_carterae.AAC.3